jgi:hypothetical protein
VPIVPSLRTSDAAPRHCCPPAPSRGSDPEYNDLCRAWHDLLAGLPPIDGWTITNELPDADALGQNFIDYFEMASRRSRCTKPLSSPERISPSTGSGSTGPPSGRPRAA